MRWEREHRNEYTPGGLSLCTQLGHDHGTQPDVGTKKYLAEFPPAHLSHLKIYCTNNMKRAFLFF